MPHDIRLALAFLTRLPFPPLPVLPDGALARAMRFFPLAGALVGAIGGGTYVLAHAVLTPGLAALLALAATIGVTGGLHEDGLADLADGFGGGGDKAAKLAIMRDSRIGSYGAITLVLGLLLRAGAVAALATPGLAAGALIAAHALARAAIPAAMQALAPARSDGLGANVGQPTGGTAAVAAALALVISLLALPSPPRRGRRRRRGLRCRGDHRPCPAPDRRPYGRCAGCGRADGGNGGLACRRGKPVSGRP